MLLLTSDLNLYSRHFVCFALICSSCGVFVVGYIIFLSFYEWLHLKHDENERLYSVRAEAATVHYADTSVTRLVPAIVFAYQVCTV
jgi:hypothetical protein